ncbi:50S ribosomal protein L6 [Endomicrobium proavitum]|uniref:50S ribosomal protein L6 n=1 Tax=Endomicrobium proavitum TaxID=1408281 RepID=A0A0G3WJ47_9BACT|nr:50S ribosomal protein L6 [Endomicrobium proavitum]AKL98686.1 50S ribosomal protein L6 [Endomicrobium proavitum]
MSRLGKKPVQLPEKVKAEFKNGVLEVTGPLGKLSQTIDKKIAVKTDAGSLLVEALGNSREHNMLHGLYRGLALNMVEGVTNGYKKELKAIGLGYKASIEGGKKLVLTVGFSHLVNLEIPATVKVTAVLDADKNTIITVTGTDKNEVGAFAAKIKAVKPPEPYKGFGIRYTKSTASADGKSVVYTDEHIIRKAGKAAAGSGKK